MLCILNKIYEAILTLFHNIVLFCLCKIIFRIAFAHKLDFFLKGIDIF